MIVYAKIVRILSLIATVSGYVYSIYKLFCKDADSVIGFVLLVFMIIVTVIVGAFEAKIGEEKCYNLMKFNIVNLLTYSLFTVNAFRCFAIGDAMMGLISAGIINSIKLFDLTNNYIFDSKKNKLYKSLHYCD